MAGPGSKPGERRGGRQKGTPNKLTQNAINRLAELGCDPLELSAKVALGQELDGPHPSLKDFSKLIRELTTAIKNETDLSAFPTRFENLVTEHLTSGHVPTDLRSMHIRDLMQYVLPKRKAVEITGKDDGPLDVSLDVSQLDSATLRSLMGALIKDDDTASQA